MSEQPIYDSGLSVVYESQNPVIDILFVHGLQGHPFRTWAYEKTSGGGSSPEIKKKKGRFFSFHRLKPTKAEPKNHHDTQDLGSSSKTETAVFWPRDLLPKECPNSRILTWAYDTIVTKYMTGSTNKSNIFAQGEELVICLGERERTGAAIVNYCPLTWRDPRQGVQVLANSAISEEPELKNIVESTAAVVFFGTPHRGSQDMAGAGEIARKVASVLMMDTSSAMLNALGLKTSDLERCQESFSRLWREYDFRVKTFQEGFPLTAFNIGFLNEKVVPDFSSTLGDSREHAETLDANHLQMCRMSGYQDPNYRKVSGEIRILYRSVVNIERATKEPESARTPLHASGAGGLSNSELACIHSLYFTKMYERKHSIGFPMEMTCKWLQNNECYGEWLHFENAEQHQGLIYIKGKPGSGKSTLMKAAMDNLVQPGASMHLVASFFFSRKGSELERTAAGFLRSITYQLIIADENIRHEFLNMFHSAITVLPDQPSTNAWDVWRNDELFRFLRKVYEQPHASRTILFVDALDECTSSDARVVAYFIRTLTMSAYKAGNHLQVCISSRNHGAVTVDKCPEILVEHFNTGDICRYLRNKLSIAGVTEAQDSARLVRLILQRSSGIFLWVKLVVDLLLVQLEQGASFKSLERRLQDIPEPLEELYAEMLKQFSHNSVEDRSISIRIFQWALFALEPLRLREWHHILAFAREPPPQSLKAWRESEFYTGSKEDLDDGKLEKQLRHLSSGLVELRTIESSHPAEISWSTTGDRTSLIAGAGSMDMEQGETRLVQVIHESVREFFLHKGGFSILDPAFTIPVIRLGNLTIINTCLNYIQIKELDSLVEARKSTDYETSDNSWQDTYSLREQLSRHGSVASFGSAASLPKPETAPDSKTPGEGIEGALAQLNNGSTQSLTEVRHGFTSSFVDQLENHGISTSMPKVLSKKSSITSSIGKTRLLEADMPLLSYATQSLFRHAALAEREGLDPKSIIDHLEPDRLSPNRVSPWQRWVYLNEEVRPSTSLLQYCVRQNLLSWIECLLAKDGHAFDLFHLSRIENNLGIAELAVSHVIRHTLTVATDNFYPDDIEAYRRHISILLAKGNVTYDDINRCLEFGSQWYIALFEGYLLNPFRPNMVPQPGVFSCWLAELLREAGVEKQMSSEGIEGDGEKLLCHLFLRFPPPFSQIQSLLEAGVNPNVAVIARVTPLHIASSYNSQPSIDLVRLLLCHGAMVDSRDFQGRRPLHFAVSCNNREVSEELLKRGAGVNAKDLRGRTPLHILANHSSSIILGTLLANGAKINAFDYNSQTPLHVVASTQGNLIPSLIHHGAAVNARDRRLQTPLHHVVSNSGRTKDSNEKALISIRNLVKAGAKTSAKDKYGETPIELAFRLGFNEAGELLQRLAPSSRSVSG